MTSQEKRMLLGPAGIAFLGRYRGELQAQDPRGKGPRTWCETVACLAIASGSDGMFEDGRTLRSARDLLARIQRDQEGTQSTLQGVEA